MGTDARDAAAGIPLVPRAAALLLGPCPFRTESCSWTELSI